MGGKSACYRLSDHFVLRFTEPVQDIEHFVFATVDASAQRSLESAYGRSGSALSAILENSVHEKRPQALRTAVSHWKSADFKKRELPKLQLRPRLDQRLLQQR